MALYAICRTADEMVRREQFLRVIEADSQDDALPAYFRAEGYESMEEAEQDYGSLRSFIAREPSEAEERDHAERQWQRGLAPMPSWVAERHARAQEAANARRRK